MRSKGPGYNSLRVEIRLMKFLNFSSNSGKVSLCHMSQGKGLMIIFQKLDPFPSKHQIENKLVLANRERPS